MIVIRDRQPSLEIGSTGRSVVERRESDILIRLCKSSGERKRTEFQ